MIPFLEADSPFPPATAASAEYGGLLAIGADLNPQRLLLAYQQGIFPWGMHEGWPLWYTPDPRMVLFPEEFRASHSLRKLIRQANYEVRFDHDFAATISACSQTPRPGQTGTWICQAMQNAYLQLHELGWAHSVEIYVEGQLIGGLYGLAIGQAFFGESMFSHRSNASKLAFAHLIDVLKAKRIEMIDCQMYTPHLASLGGREIPRSEFLARLRALTTTSPPESWQMYTRTSAC